MATARDCSSLHLLSSRDCAAWGPLMTTSCHVLVAELYASNYDNVSRPCSTAAAGLQPETGYQPAGQCCQLSISWGGTTGMLSSLCSDVMWHTLVVLVLWHSHERLRFHKIKALFRPFGQSRIKQWDLPDVCMLPIMFLMLFFYYLLELRHLPLHRPIRTIHLDIDTSGKENAWETLLQYASLTLAKFRCFLCCFFNCHI